MRQERRDSNMGRSPCRSSFKDGGSVPNIEIIINVPEEHNNEKRQESRRASKKHEEPVDDYYASFPKEFHDTRHMEIKNKKETRPEHHEEKKHERKKDTGLGYNEAMRPSDYVREKSAKGNNRAQSDNPQFTGRREKRGSFDELNGITKKLNTPANQISLGKANSQNFKKGGQVDIDYGPNIKFREDQEIEKLERAAARSHDNDHYHPESTARTYRRGGQVEAYDCDGREKHSWGDFVNGFKSIGHGIKHAAEGVGHGIENIGSKALHGVEDVGKTIGKGVVNVGKSALHGVEDAGIQTYHGLKDAGEATYGGLKKAAPYLAQAGQVAIPIIGEAAGSLLGPAGAMLGSVLGNVGSSAIGMYAPPIGGKPKQKPMPTYDDGYTPQAEDAMATQSFRRGGQVARPTDLEDRGPQCKASFGGMMGNTKLQKAAPLTKKMASLPSALPEDEKNALKNGGINIKHPGKLHNRLGIPKGEKIPMKMIKQAEQSRSKSLRKEAQFADNFRQRPQGR